MTHRIGSHEDKAKFTLQHEYFWRLNGYVHETKWWTLTNFALRIVDGMEGLGEFVSAHLCRCRPQTFLIFGRLYFFSCVKWESTSDWVNRACLCFLIWSTLVDPLQWRQAVCTLWLCCIIIVTQKKESFAFYRGGVNIIFGGNEVAWI